MRIMTRYVLTEVLKVFAMTLVGMTTFMLIIGVVREAVSQGLGLTQIVRLMPYILPDSLRFTVPGTILFATCSVYGRMSADSEFTAIKSAGVNPLSMFWPTFALAAMLSLATVWLNDVAVSWGRNGARRVVIEAVDAIVYGMLRTQRSYSTDDFSINVKRVDDRKLINTTITFRGGHDAPSATITAEEAQIRLDREQQQLIFRCRNGTIDFGGRGSLKFTDTIERALPLEEASRAQSSGKSPSWLAMREIGRELREQRRQIDAHLQEVTLQAAFDMLSGDFDALTSGEWDTEAKQLERMRERTNRLLLEPHRRWANGFSCLFFAMVGGPMAVRLRFTGLWGTLFACFLPILVIYYPMLAGTVDMAKSGRLPAYAVWMGNIALAGWSAWLMVKVRRY